MLYLLSYILKAGNHYLSIVSRINEIVYIMVRQFNSSETNVVLKVLKTLIKLHIEYYTQVWALEPSHLLERNIQIEEDTKKNYT